MDTLYRAQWSLWGVAHRKQRFRTHTLQSDTNTHLSALPLCQVLHHHAARLSLGRLPLTTLASSWAWFRPSLGPIWPRSGC
jgi:hypothetical protein